MLREEELPYCRFCNTKVINKTGEYYCGKCNMDLHPIETYFISDTLTSVKEVNCKTLEKLMTYDELKEFLRTRPNYRIPREEELEEFKPYLPVKSFFVVGSKQINDQEYPKIGQLIGDDVRFSYESPLFKFKVFLIKSH